MAAIESLPQSPAVTPCALAACARARSENPPCPAVVAYGKDFLAQAANEVDKLPAGSAIEQMLADYQVMRDEAGVCGSTSDF
jgi:hypothetical protein